MTFPSTISAPASAENEAREARKRGKNSRMDSWFGGVYTGEEMGFIRKEKVFSRFERLDGSSRPRFERPDGKSRSCALNLSIRPPPL